MVVMGALVVWGAQPGRGLLRPRLRVRPEFTRCFGLGFLTFVTASPSSSWCPRVIWVPVGAKIGMSPKLSRDAQPVVQVLASFPAILLFPFAIVVFLALGIALDFGGILLMALGCAVVHPVQRDRREPVPSRPSCGSWRTSSAVPWRQRWRELILPGIFPFYVTGGITAAGGAWNASIVAEITATYGKHHLVAGGLGSYIAQATTRGDFPEVLTGIIVMSFYVVVVNRLLWRPMYRLAEDQVLVMIPNELSR